MRKAEMKRTTKETDIALKLNLDQGGNSQIDTGVGFLNHMLELFAKHANITLKVTCKGDTDVDDHHSTEDIGIVLGEAFRKAIGDKKGIRRYGNIFLPMDEALVLVALDISGRGGAYTEVSFPSEKIGTFDTELVEEFLIAFASHAGITLHVRMLSGRNSHHIAEAIFKGLGRALKEAISIDLDTKDAIPSTKGSLSC